MATVPTRRPTRRRCAITCAHSSRSPTSARATGRAASARPKRRNTGEAEWIAGRNSVVESLREGVPINGVYVAEGAERDGRLREAFRLASERGVSVRDHGARSRPYAR